MAWVANGLYSCPMVALVQQFVAGLFSPLRVFSLSGLGGRRVCFLLSGCWCRPIVCLGIGLVRLDRTPRLFFGPLFILPSFLGQRSPAGSAAGRPTRKNKFALVASSVEEKQGGGEREDKDQKNTI